MSCTRRQVWLSVSRWPAGWSRAQQVRQQRLHAAAGEQRGRVVLGDQRRAGNDDVALLDHEFEVDPADLVGVHADMIAAVDGDAAIGEPESQKAGTEARFADLRDEGQPAAPGTPRPTVTEDLDDEHRGQAISALRTGHDTLDRAGPKLPPGGLTGPSGASEWTIAEVLSHLGSGAEIGLAEPGGLVGRATPRRAATSTRGCGTGGTRWRPEEQADDFVKANEALVQRYEGLDEQTRQEAKVKLFLPEPVDVATAAGFRLNEFTLHAWDVEVGPATRRPRSPRGGRGPARHRAVHVRLARQAEGRPGRQIVAVAVHTTDPARDFGLAITDKVALTDSPANAGCGR